MSNQKKCINHAIVSFISAKGGVGTSTLVKEMAIGFSKDISVCVIDFAFSCPAQSALFHVLPAKTVEDLFPSTGHHKNTLSWEELEPYLTLVPDRNIHLLPCRMMKGSYPLTSDQILQLVYSLEMHFDLILLDADLSSSDAAAKIVMLSDLCIMTVNDTENAIKISQRFRRLLTTKKISYDHMKLLLNQVTLKDRMYSGKDIENLLHIPLLLSINQFDQVWKYNNSYLPLCEDPENPIYPSLMLLKNLLTNLLEE